MSPRTSLDWLLADQPKSIDEDSIPESDLGPRPECFANTTSEVLFIVVATMSVAMTSTLVGGLTVVSAAIGSDLNMSDAEVSWITASESLTAGSFLLFSGKVADLFGRKKQFVASLFLFSVFSTVAGFAQHGVMFDLCTGLMGIMSASAVPPAIGSLGAVYEKPCRRKNYAFACFSAGNPLGYVFGSLSCGIFTQFLSWRAYMHFMGAVYFVFTIIALIVTPVDDSDKAPLSWSTIRNFDSLGTVLTISGFGLVSASLTLAGDAPDGWSTPYVYVTLIVGTVALIAFLYWETIATSPLMPMWVWKDRDFSLILLLLFIGNGTFTSSTFWVTLYIQRFKSSSSLQVACYILPMAVMGITANVVAGLTLDRISNKILMFVGTLSFAISFLLFGLNRDDDSYWSFLFWAFALCVWGADLQFNVANMYVMTTLPSSHQSTGGGIFQTVSKLGSVIVMGIATAIYHAVQKNPPTSGYYGHQNVAPYSGVFLFTATTVGFSLIAVLFLRVGTQGRRKSAILE